MRSAVPSFGVGTKRFTNSNPNNILQVGPGSYDPKLDIRKIKNRTRPVIPPKDAARFPELLNNKKVE